MATGSDQSSPAGKLGAAELLDDVGGVGAEHHHLAMRHVDDAHHAEGDGEADRGQQQDRAQADAVDHVLRRGDELAGGARSRSRRVGRGGAHALGRRRPAASARIAQHLLVAALRQQRHSLEPDRLRPRSAWPSRMAAAGLRPGPAAAVGVLLAAPAPAPGPAGPSRSRERNTAWRRLEALGRIRAHQGEAAERGLDRAADAVVDPHRLEPAGAIRRHRGARGRVEQRCRRRP